MQNEYYIKPIKQTDFSIKIDWFLNITALVCTFAILVAAIDKFITKYGFGDKILNLNNIEHYMVFCIVIGFIGFLNGNFSRRMVNREYYTKLAYEAKTLKFRKTILLILKQNEKLTVGELNVIKEKMKKELDQLHKTGYKVKIMSDLKSDIQLVENAISHSGF